MIWKFSSRSSRLNPLRHAVIIQTQFTVSLCNIIISISAIILWFSRYVYVIYSYKYSYKYFFYFLSAEKTQSPDSTPCESVTDTKNEKPTGIWLLKFSNYVWMNALLLCFLWFDSGNTFLFQYHKHIDKRIHAELSYVLRKHFLHCSCIIILKKT